jgi:ParB family transcriptional regulator, chromosome partitioning protein
MSRSALHATTYGKKEYYVREEATRQLISTVSPFRCRMWTLHDRCQDHITEDSCREEIKSFQKHGQLVPALGRPLRNDPTHDVELIFGARRLFVARHLNLSLRVELRELSDREAIAAMDIENRQRQDISAYERGASYAAWLRDGYFGSQEELATALRISASQVSRMLKIARLPPVILNAFESPARICEGWGLELAAALEDPQRREHTIRKAREIVRSEQRVPAAEVYRRLLSAAAVGRKPAAKARDEVILNDHGAPLFRIRYVRAAVMLMLPVQRVSARSLQEIRGAVTTILGHESPESREMAGKRLVEPTSTGLQM